MENKIYGRVYLITNLINGKQYIGQTVQTIKSRFNRHCNNAKNNIDLTMVIVLAIKKYNKENFIIRELAIAYNQEDLTFLEGLYISWFNTLAPNGYNITKIINGKSRHSEETKQKIKMAHNKPENLKIASELGKQTRGKSLGGSSKYVGVVKSNNIYSAQIKFNKSVHIGHYNNETDAAKAYDIKALEFFGHDCNLNFPELREDYINGKIIINKNAKHNRSKSGVKGIHFHSRRNYWVLNWKCNITNKAKSKYFKTLEEAIIFDKLK